MFRFSTILRELVQSLAKVTLLLKHSVKLRRCILCGVVAACCEMACVLFVVQTDTESVKMCEYFNLLTLLSYNFNSFVTLAKQRVKTP